MPVAIVRPREEVIAEEQDYLFHDDRADLAAPTWSRAACRDASPDWFFPISERDAHSRGLALSFCGRCPISAACLDVAMRDRTLLGIWGGTDEHDRARLRRDRLRVG